MAVKNKGTISNKFTMYVPSVNGCLIGNTCANFPTGNPQCKALCSHFNCLDIDYSKVAFTVV